MSRKSLVTYREDGLFSRSSALNFDPRAKTRWAEQGVRKASQEKGPR